MAENKRKAISKKTRFEVFKRDRFTCQYCGRHAPDVVLECDHIKPVADGGKNNILNLVTACRDCNRGKGKTLLSDSSAVEIQFQQMADLSERREFSFAFDKIGGICYNRAHHIGSDKYGY